MIIVTGSVHRTLATTEGMKVYEVVMYWCMENNISKGYANSYFLCFLKMAPSWELATIARKFLDFK